jgi:hypothetical protein
MLKQNIAPLVTPALDHVFSPAHHFLCCKKAWGFTNMTNNLTFKIELLNTGRRAQDQEKCFAEKISDNLQ